MAFQIFYIAINVSVIVGPLVSGTLGEKIGWHWGFGCAGVVMVLGLLLFLAGRPYLPDNSKQEKVQPREKMGPGDWPRVIALMLLVPAMAIGLLTNQQIFNAYLVWADQQFQLTFFGITMPTSWMITIDAALSFSMLVAVAAFWKWKSVRTGTEPDELGKMIIGSFFTIAGGLCLYMAALTQGSGKIGLFWPVMFHLLNSIGFAHILPVSLALFSKIAPRAINATVIGIYYLAFFLANKMVGYVGEWFSSMPTTTFWLLHVASAVVGLVAFVVFKMTIGRRMAHAQELAPA
jgi:POT family proton-dependent oligopeptide transporter